MITYHSMGIAAWARSLALWGALWEVYGSCKKENPRCNWAQIRRSTLTDKRGVDIQTGKWIHIGKLSS